MEDYAALVERIEREAKTWTGNAPIEMLLREAASAITTLTHGKPRGPRSDKVFWWETPC